MLEPCRRNGLLLVRSLLCHRLKVPSFPSWHLPSLLGIDPTQVSRSPWGSRKQPAPPCPGSKFVAEMTEWLACCVVKGGGAGEGPVDQLELVCTEEGWGGGAGLPPSRPCPCTWGLRWSVLARRGLSLQNVPTACPCWAGVTSGPGNRNPLTSVPVLPARGEAHLG